MTQVTVECKECGKEFKPNPGNSNNFCSRQCYYDSMKAKVDKACLNCGVVFSVKKSRAETAKYCSQQCHGEDKRGEDNPNWKGNPGGLRDTLEYHKWRTSVFHRDNYTCQKCGQHSGILHAHHIAAFSEYPEARLLEDNGMTLCKECHREFHNIYGTVGFTPEHFWVFMEVT